MNAEELCNKMQEEKKADSENCYEEEMSSSEYFSKYSGTPWYSVRKHLQIIRNEQKKYKRNY